MSWQDELRQLDEELAAGRIGAEQYRARRDQVIAAAANPTGAQPPSSAESTTMLPPVGPPSGPQPQQSMPPQPVNPMPDNPDRTQAITPNWQTGPRPDAGMGMPGPGYPPGPHSPAQGFQQQQSPWGEQPADSAPPWAGQDFPPLAANNESWVKQGPETFSEGKSNTGRIIAIVGVVVVLIGLGIGAFVLFGKGGGGNNTNQAGGATSTTTTAPPTTTTPPSPVRIGAIPGTDTGKSITSAGDLAQLNYLNPNELQAYQTATNGSGLAKIEVHQLDDGDLAIVLTVQAQSAAAANTAVNTLTNIQTNNKATQVQAPVVGVQMTSVTDGGNTTIRAHYVHDNVIVRVEVRGPNPTTALQDMTTVLNAQLAALSANG